MARRNYAPGNSSYRLACSDRGEIKHRRPEVSAQLERRWFEFDRNVVSSVLDTLKGALHEGAAQMEMIAAERMFNVSLSGTLSRTARRLGQMETQLNKLGVEVEGATGYPARVQKT